MVHRIRLGMGRWLKLSVLVLAFCFGLTSCGFSESSQKVWTGDDVYSALIDIDTQGAAGNLLACMYKLRLTNLSTGGLTGKQLSESEYAELASGFEEGEKLVSLLASGEFKEALESRQVEKPIEYCLSLGEWSPQGEWLGSKGAPVEDFASSPENNVSAIDNSDRLGKECDVVDEISPDGKYICAWHGSGVWVLRDSGAVKAPTVPQQTTGRWVQKCDFVQVPNPNYDARRGYSAGVNMPTLTTQQCSQVYIQE